MSKKAGDSFYSIRPLMCGVSKFSKCTHQKRTFSFSRVPKWQPKLRVPSFNPLPSLKCKKSARKNKNFSRTSLWSVTAECRGINLPGNLHLCGVQNATSAKSGTIGNTSLPFLTWSLKVQMPLGGARSVRRLSRNRKTIDLIRNL